MDDTPISLPSLSKRALQKGGIGVVISVTIVSVFGFAVVCLLLDVSGVLPRIWRRLYGDRRWRAKENERIRLERMEMLQEMRDFENYP